MAYIVNPFADDELKQQPQGPGGPAPAVGPADTRPSSPFAAVAKPKTATGSGQYYDFSRLLAANKGRGTALANQMTAGVNKATTDAQAAVGKVSDTFNTAAAGGLPVGAPPPVYTPGPGAASAGTGHGTTAKGAPAGVKAVAPDYSADSYARDAERYQNTQYQGPQTLAGVEGFQGAQDAVRRAQEQAQALAGNRGALIDGGAGYNQGSRAFDVLVSGAGGHKQFDAAQSQAAELSKLFGTAQTDAQRVAGEKNTLAQRYRDSGNQMAQLHQTQVASNTAAANENEIQRQNDERDLAAAKGINAPLSWLGQEPTLEMWQRLTPEARAYASQNGMTKLLLFKDDTFRYGTAPSGYTGPGGTVTSSTAGTR